MNYTHYTKDIQWKERESKREEERREVGEEEKRGGQWAERGKARHSDVGGL